MDLSAGDIVGDKYVLERVLGEGSMGSVWRAEHKVLRSPVAIKLLRTEHAQTEISRARFEREAMTMARLRSRHIISVNDYGVDDTHAFIVMEMLEGEDFGARLRQRGRLAPAELIPIVHQVAKGLQVAHDAAIIHRDLKPANIFLAREDGEEVVKLLDFGLAKATTATPGGTMLRGPRGVQTKMGALLGSPHYMSPEHIQGNWDVVDHRSDLWSFAVIIYRAIIDVMPFPGDDLPTVWNGICAEDPLPITRHDPRLPVALDQFFARALAKTKEHRFNRAVEMAEALAGVYGYAVPSSTPAAGHSAPSLPVAPQAPTHAQEVTMALEEGFTLRDHEPEIPEELVATLRQPDPDEATQAMVVPAPPVPEVVPHAPPTSAPMTTPSHRVPSLAPSPVWPQPYGAETPPGAFGPRSRARSESALLAKVAMIGVVAIIGIVIIAMAYLAQGADAGDRTEKKKP